MNQMVSGGEGGASIPPPPPPQTAAESAVSSPRDNPGNARSRAAGENAPLVPAPRSAEDQPRLFATASETSSVLRARLRLFSKAVTLLFADKDREWRFRVHSFGRQGLSRMLTMRLLPFVLAFSLAAATTTCANSRYVALATIVVVSALATAGAIAAEGGMPSSWLASASVVKGPRNKFVVRGVELANFLVAAPLVAAVLLRRPVVESTSAFIDTSVVFAAAFPPVVSLSGGAPRVLLLHVLHVLVFLLFSAEEVAATSFGQTESVELLWLATLLVVASSLTRWLELLRRQHVARCLALHTLCSDLVESRLSADRQLLSLFPPSIVPHLRADGVRQMDVAASAAILLVELGDVSAWGSSLATPLDALRLTRDYFDTLFWRGRHASMERVTVFGDRCVFVASSFFVASGRVKPEPSDEGAAGQATSLSGDLFVASVSAGAGAAALAAAARRSVVSDGASASGGGMPRVGRGPSSEAGCSMFSAAGLDPAAALAPSRAVAVACRFAMMCIQAAKPMGPPVAAGGASSSSAHGVPAVAAASAATATLAVSIPARCAIHVGDTAGLTMRQGFRFRYDLVGEGLCTAQILAGYCPPLTTHLTETAAKHLGGYHPFQLERVALPPLPPATNAEATAPTPAAVGESVSPPQHPPQPALGSSLVCFRLEGAFRMRGSAAGASASESFVPSRPSSGRLRRSGATSPLWSPTESRRRDGGTSGPIEDWRAQLPEAVEAYGNVLNGSASSFAGACNGNATPRGSMTSVVSTGAVILSGSGPVPPPQLRRQSMSIEDGQPSHGSTGHGSRVGFTRQSVRQLVQVIEAPPQQEQHATPSHHLGSPDAPASGIQSAVRSACNSPMLMGQATPTMPDLPVELSGVLSSRASDVPRPDDNQSPQRRVSTATAAASSGRPPLTGLNNGGAAGIGGAQQDVAHGPAALAAARIAAVAAVGPERAPKRGLQSVTSFTTNDDLVLLLPTVSPYAAVVRQLLLEENCGATTGTAVSCEDMTAIPQLPDAARQLTLVVGKPANLYCQTFAEPAAEELYASVKVTMRGPCGTAPVVPAVCAALATTASLIHAWLVGNSLVLPIVGVVFFFAACGAVLAASVVATRRLSVPLFFGLAVLWCAGHAALGAAVVRTHNDSTATPPPSAVTTSNGPPQGLVGGPADRGRLSGSSIMSSEHTVFLDFCILFVLLCVTIPATLGSLKCPPKMNALLSIGVTGVPFAVVLGLVGPTRDSIAAFITGIAFLLATAWAWDRAFRHWFVVARLFSVAFRWAGTEDRGTTRPLLFGYTRDESEVLLKSLLSSERLSVVTLPSEHGRPASGGEAARKRDLRELEVIEDRRRNEPQRGASADAIGSLAAAGSNYRKQAHSSALPHQRPSQSLLSRVPDESGLIVAPPQMLHCCLRLVGINECVRSGALQARKEDAHLIAEATAVAMENCWCKLAAVVNECCTTVLKVAVEGDTVMLAGPYHDGHWASWEEATHAAALEIVSVVLHLCSSSIICTVAIDVAPALVSAVNLPLLTVVSTGQFVARSVVVHSPLAGCVLMTTKAAALFQGAMAKMDLSLLANGSPPIADGGDAGGQANNNNNNNNNPAARRRLHPLLPSTALGAALGLLVPGIGILEVHQLGVVVPQPQQQPQQPQQQQQLPSPALRPE